MRREPMRKPFLTLNSMQFSPTIVEIIKIATPRSPENRKIIVVRKKVIKREIFE